MKPIPLIALSFLLLAACRKTEKTPPDLSDGTSSTDKALLAAVFSTEPKGPAKAIKEVKSSAKPGDEVVLTGRIMGNLKPFVDGRAAFMVADPSILTACSDHPGDECATPWDACCDSPEDKKKAIATIQIVDSDGRVLKQSVEGSGGLAPLDSVTVRGTVAKGSEGDVLIVNATAIRATK